MRSGIMFDARNGVDKSLTLAREFGMLNAFLTGIILPEMAIKYREHGCIMTVIGITEGAEGYDCPIDMQAHKEYRAIDILAWGLTLSQRVDTEKHLNAKFTRYSDENVENKITIYHPGQTGTRPYFHVSICKGATYRKNGTIGPADKEC